MEQAVLRVFSIVIYEWLLSAQWCNYAILNNGLVMFRVILYSKCITTVYLWLGGSVLFTWLSMSVTIILFFFELFFQILKKKDDRWLKFEWKEIMIADAKSN